MKKFIGRPAFSSTLHEIQTWQKQTERTPGDAGLPDASYGSTSQNVLQPADFEKSGKLFWTTM
jgi:hypothetical protein